MTKYYSFIIAFFLYACYPNESTNHVNMTDQSLAQKFNKELWNTSNDGAYPHRIKFIDNILYSDTIRNLNKTQAMKLLGVPDYEKEDHLYYKISQTKLGFWTLHSKTLVIKIKENDSIDWIKMHG